ncbi:hypothetical protein BU17DRAFT_63388 [Hysterangium stoloniferum]|nr:hypothetical protein BU17DRAFT_63388 [Hysterangium stoloniferum]
MVNSPIYYGYNGSPFVSKLETILLLKGIPARRVALYPPRPELLNLGLSYRRVPVLALGRDLYIDTALILDVLETKFPEPTMFPPRKGSGTTDKGLQKAFSQFYADKFLFSLGFHLLPWLKTPKALQEDRMKFVGRTLDYSEMAAHKSHKHSELVSHLTLFEEQLSDGRDWFLDSSTPGHADVSLHFILTWMRSFRDTRPVFDSTQFPRTIAWLGRLDDILKEKRQALPQIITKISGEEATKEILSGSFNDVSIIGFDEVQMKALGLTKGARVSVIPDDSGKDGRTIGTLVGLDRRVMVLETDGQERSGGPPSVRVYFPRLGYVVEPEGGPASKL